MSLSSPDYFLTKAYDNVFQVLNSHKDKACKKKLYLTSKFEISRKPVEVNASDLITLIKKTFFESADSDRLKKAKEIFGFFMQIPVLKEQFNPSLIQQVKEASAYLHTSQLEDHFAVLTTFSALQKFVQTVSECIEIALNIHSQRTLFLKNGDCEIFEDHGKEVVSFLAGNLSKEALLSLMNSPLGMALVAKMRWVQRDDQYSTPMDDLTLEELEEMSKLLEVMSFIDCPPKICSFFKAQHLAVNHQFLRKKLEEHERLLNATLLSFQKQLEPDSAYSRFIISYLPELVDLYQATIREISKSDTSLCNSLIMLTSDVINTYEKDEYFYSLYKSNYDCYQQLLLKRPLFALSTSTTSSTQDKFSSTSFLTPEELGIGPFGLVNIFSPLDPSISIKEKEESKEPKKEVLKDGLTAESAALSKKPPKKAHRGKKKPKSSPSHKASSVAPTTPSSSSSSSIGVGIEISPSCSSSSPSSSSSAPSTLSSSSSCSSPSFSSSPSPTLPSSSSRTSSTTDVAAPAVIPSACTPSKARPTPLPTTLFANQRVFSEENYAQRVSDWFEHPERSLSQPKYASFTPHQKQESTWYHAFSPFVDKFVGTLYSYKDEWRTKKGERHTFYGVVGEVTSKGKTYRGVFQYCFDNHGVLYHRCFGHKSNIQLLDFFINRQLPEIEYPSLAESVGLGKVKSKAQISTDGIPYEVGPLHAISFEDPRHELSIRLFKMGERHSSI